jgi:uncharacterized protein (TIGR02611 family)
MDAWKRRWKKIPSAVRKPLIFIIGLAIIVAGLAMLVLPGPGWAAIFLGFAVLATEFAFADKVRVWTIAQLKRAMHHGQRLWKKFRRRHSRPKP